MCLEGWYSYQTRLWPTEINVTKRIISCRIKNNWNCWSLQPRFKDLTIESKQALHRGKVKKNASITQNLSSSTKHITPIWSSQEKYEEMQKKVVIEQVP
jgi:hypothetical protein